MRVTLVDDSIIMRDGLAHVLTSHGAVITGLARDGTEALLAVARHRPDIVVLDMRMPPSHTDEGLLTAESIRRNHPHVGILLLAQDADSAHVERLLNQTQRGIGYLLKDRVADWTQFVDAIKRVAGGGAAVDPEIVELMLRRRTVGVGDDTLAALTPRERTVLTLMAEGLNNLGIADRLSVSPRTIETHVKAVFDKLGLQLRPGEDRRIRAVTAYLRATGL
jgi:DNA-binding NarL/FixJ family response regulator